MNTRNRILTGILLILIGMVGGMLVMVYVAGAGLDRRPTVSETTIFRADPAADAQAGSSALPDLKQVTREVTPAVVYIESEIRTDAGRDPSILDRVMPRRESTSIGSGVLITGDGHILTNNHVIADAVEDGITVGLSDKRTFPARIVGRDPSTDLAVLKIEGDRLTPIVLGDSDGVDVGDWVMAVGNPFRLRSTVTAGIVSALGRDVAIINDRMRIESFIQTDAAINRGNSGGALVNTDGHLIGINTAIATENGAYQGYGFAVPINLAYKIARDLIETGAVNRAFLGVQILPVDQDRSETAGLPDVRGVEIATLVRGGSADRGGLRAGDIVLSVNGRDVNEPNELQTRIALLRPGDTVNLRVWREGRDVTLRFALEGMESEPMRRWAQE